MKKSVSAIFAFTVICLVYGGANAQKNAKNVEISAPKNYRAAQLENSPELQTLLSRAVGETLNSYPPGGFKSDDISATLIDLRDANNFKQADFRGDMQIYPASVVKMFYMAALERLLEDGKIKSSPELERGLKDMIVDSSNEATQYILDAITGTSSGAELPAKEFAEWSFKRNAVNRFYSSLGYERINVNQKTHCEDAYGREQQFRNYKGENRNMLTTNATARLLAEIVTGRIAPPERTKKMLDLMRRDPFAESKDPDNQANGFTGKALIAKKMSDARLWSKAGWTSRSRHDAAYVETADGLKFVLVIFTENHAADQAPIPTIAGKIIDGLKAIK